MLKRWINLKNPHSGSCYDKTRNKWYVKITLKKKIYNLGRYDTLVHLPIKSRKLYFQCIGKLYCCSDLVCLF